MADTPIFDPAAFKQFEHDGWEAVSSTYVDAFGVLTDQAIQPLLDAAAVAPGMQVLDVACGPGRLAAAAAARGAQATGLDYVAKMVEAAQAAHPTVSYRQGDAEALPYEAGTFDAVLCSFGVLHFPRPDVALAEAFRVLKPGGRFALTAWVPPDRSPLMGLIYRTFQAHAAFKASVPTGPDTFQFGDPEACRGLLAGAGLAQLAEREVPIVARFAAPEGVLNMILGGTARTRGVLERLTEASRRKVIEVIVQEAAGFAQAGGIQIPVPALLAQGRKP